MNNKERVVFILGAGFSAPAKLPIQNRILDEMIKKPAEDFLSYSPEPESTKFLVSFINVGLYLLQNYTSVECKDCFEEFSNLQIKSRYARQIDEDLLSVDAEKSELMLLQEKIRSRLESSKIQVCLEDVFTSFDKTYQSREFFHMYSSHNAEEIKESITRLFVYYFSRCCLTHKYQTEDYVSFCNYLKQTDSPTIISTNWDVLTEEYLQKQNIKYGLCLKNDYYRIGKQTKPPKRDQVSLIKLHGSINWFRCLNCGTINIVENSESGKYLFDDKSTEECRSCKSKRENGFLLQSQIITPTMMKSFSGQLYSNLWSAARESLRNANHVYFIGYSLPNADYDFRYMLHQSIPNDARIDVILYHDDDPAQTENKKLIELLPEKRYRDLFAKNDLHFFYNGFGEYFKNSLAPKEQNGIVSPSIEL